MKSMMLSLLRNLKHFSEELLKGYKEVASNAGVKNVETRLEFGSPKAIIPKKLAHEVGADLIMSGTSGLNAVERFIVGSVSEAIVRHAPCDVLVVRTEEIPEDFQPQVATPKLRKISRLRLNIFLFFMRVS